MLLHLSDVSPPGSSAAHRGRSSQSCASLVRHLPGPATHGGASAHHVCARERSPDLVLGSERTLWAPLGTSAEVALRAVTRAQTGPATGVRLPSSAALPTTSVPLGHPVLAAPASATQAANQGSSPHAGAVPGPAGPMSLLLSIAPRPCSAWTPLTSHLDPDRLPCFRLSSLNPTDVRGPSLSTGCLPASISKIRS